MVVCRAQAMDVVVTGKAKKMVRVRAETWT
jgi:hypothetical protein